jgi:RNA polymerase primary sigma factor
MKNHPSSIVLHHLHQEKKELLRMRFGIGMTLLNYTLDEIGQVLNVSGDRIRCIEAKALRKLKHPSRAQTLKELLEND